MVLADQEPARTLWLNSPFFIPKATQLLKPLVSIAYRPYSPTLTIVRMIGFVRTIQAKAPRV